MTSMEGLFINDNLTPYNVALLKELKHKKSRRSIDGLNSFHAAYSYQGKVFGKKLSSDMFSEAVWIKNPACLKASTDDVVLLEVFAASSNFAALAGNFTHFLLQNLLVVSYTCSYSFLKLTIRCAAWNLRAQMYSICPKGLTFWHQKYTLIFPNPPPPLRS